MGEILAFSEEHAAGVARLYMLAGRGLKTEPSQALIDYFCQLHFDNPWASPDMPSLVYVEKGKVIGMIGVVPRQMKFRGRPVTIATKSMYIVDPESRNGPAAIKLLRGMLKGPQEFSWTDGASGHVSTLWTAMGGHTASLYGFNWTRILRPFATARMGLGRIGGAGRAFRTAARLVTRPVDSLLAKALPGLMKEPVSAYSAELSTVSQILDCIEELEGRENFRPFYTRETFPWLMNEVGKNPGGDLRMMTVLTPEGKRAGWFIYFAAKGGASFVLQIGVRSKEDFRDTFLALLRDAWEQGSACVKGASIPQHLTTLTELNCFFRHPHDRVVIHARDPEIANAVRTGEAAITRLDGTGWMRFAWEKWD